MPSRLATAAWVLVCWLALWHFWPIDAIHFDSSRDLLIARDCYELGRCDGHGPPTSFTGLFQGVLWNNALGLLRWLGLSPKGIGLAIAGIYALVLGATMRWHRSADGPALWLLLLAGAIAMMPVVLWSPTLFFPAMILTTWLTLDWLAQPRWPLALGLGLLWGVTLDLYLAAGPVLLATIALGLRARKPVQTLAIVAIALFVGLAVSPGAWTGTLAFIPLHPLRVLAVLLAFAGMLALAIRAPRRDAVALLALAGTGAWLVIGTTRLFQSRYLMPGFAALALLIAQRIPRALAWPVGAVAVGLATLLVVHPQPELTYRNAEALATAMTQHHVGWPEALAHTQGEFSRQLAPTTAVFLPHARTPWQGEDVAVNLTATPRFAGVPTRMDLTDAELCKHAKGQRICQPLSLDPTPPGSTFPLAVAVYAAVIAQPPPEVTALELRVAVRAGPAETLQLLPQFPRDTCPWTFTGGTTALELRAQATQVRMIRRFTAGVCPHGGATWEWLAPWRETPHDSLARAVPPPPPVPRLLHPVLARSGEAQFRQLAALLARDRGGPEPDIAVHRDHAQVSWPGQPPVALRFAAEAPWFQVLDPAGDISRTAAIVRALPLAFTASPWREADAPAAAQRVAAKPMWPHLTLAALGLLVLGLAAWRVARG